MKALVIKPGARPFVDDIGPDLKDLQRAVEGYIQAVYPFDDPVALICNEEAKLEGLPLNRVIRDSDGQPFDVIAGTFLIVGLTEDDFGPLPTELVDKYMDLFRYPEAFLSIKNRMLVIPEHGEPYPLY